MDQATMTAMAASAQAASDAKAETMQSDEDAPGELLRIAEIVTAATGQRVTAIQQGDDTRFEPASPVADHLMWNLRCLAGRQLKIDPPAVKIASRAWYFAVVGNPILIEAELRKLGYEDSLATAPGWCRVMPV